MPQMINTSNVTCTVETIL